MPGFQSKMKCLTRGAAHGVALQRILGHTSMTMRYAHLTQEHLESAMRFSPITQSGYKLTT